MVWQSACDLAPYKIGEIDFFFGLCIYISYIIMTCTTVYHSYRAGSLRQDHRLMSAENKTGYQRADFLKPSLKRALLHWVSRSSIIMHVLDSYLILEFSWFPQAPRGTASPAMPTSFHIPYNFLVADNRIIRLCIITVFEGVAKWTTNKYGVPILRPHQGQQPFCTESPHSPRHLVIGAVLRAIKDTLYKCSFFFFYNLICCRRVLLEKLIGSMLVKKFPAFYGTLKFITAFTSASQINAVHAPHPTSWRSILILSPFYAWVFQVVSFPQISPPKPCIHLSSPPYVLHAPPT